MSVQACNGIALPIYYVTGRKQNLLIEWTVARVFTLVSVSFNYLTIIKET